MKAIKLVRSQDLTHLAKRYIWWQSSDWAYTHPEFFLAQVMNLGHWDDMQCLMRLVDKETFKQILRHAPAGYFQARSWDYWHKKLNIKPIPPLPQRKY